MFVDPTDVSMLVIQDDQSAKKESFHPLHLVETVPVKG